jgi:hypothetical protein
MDSWFVLTPVMGSFCLNGVASEAIGEMGMQKTSARRAMLAGPSDRFIVTAGTLMHLELCFQVVLVELEPGSRQIP